MSDKVKIFFGNGGFYRTDFHTHEQIPVNAVEITEKRYDELLANQTRGEEIFTDASGRPNTRPPAPPTPGALEEQARESARQSRARVMPILDGLQSSALVKGDQKAAKSIEETKEKLRRVTDLDFSKANTPEEREAVVDRAFEEIVKGASETERKAFTGVR